MSIADKLTLLNSTKAAIASAIEAKGVTVGSIPFADYPTKIAEITGGAVEEGWVRPADWLALPTLTSEDNKFVGLLAVTNDESNFVALSAMGAYTVDWGDGIVENFASNAKAEHVYTYANHAGTESTRGYRQAIVTVTPQEGQLFQVINLQQTHSTIPSAKNTKWLDIVVAGNSLIAAGIGTQYPITYINWLERCRVVHSAITNTNYMFSEATNLQSVEFTSRSTVTTAIGMFNKCSSLVEAPELNATTAFTNTSYMFADCTSLNTLPNYSVSSVTNASYMFSNCTSLTLIPSFNFSSSLTNVANMFAGCSSLKEVDIFASTYGISDASNLFLNCKALTKVSALQFSGIAISPAGMFSGCESLQEVPVIGLNAAISAQNVFSGCRSLVKVGAINLGSISITYSGAFTNCSSLAAIESTGMKVSFSVANCNLGPAALNTLYTNLATVSSATITVTGNWGTASDDPTIATAKGWTVTG